MEHEHIWIYYPDDKIRQCDECLKVESIKERD